MSFLHCEIRQRTLAVSADSATGAPVSLGSSPWVTCPNWIAGVSREGAGLAKFMGLGRAVRLVAGQSTCDLVSADRAEALVALKHR